jgi:hypothetical protein
VRSRRRPVTFGGNIIETGTDPSRLAHTKVKQAASEELAP